ncbi:MAG: hypothetical protein DMG37_03655 [Acidobacteria bacterium]|nr:MAG: hypothetical protein DMG37_03655 [Acidobacteriota bacterium]
MILIPSEARHLVFGRIQSKSRFLVAPPAWRAGCAPRNDTIYFVLIEFSNKLSGWKIPKLKTANGER